MPHSGEINRRNTHVDARRLDQARHGYLRLTTLGESDPTLDTEATWPTSH
jgi:hypothetical protein